MEEEGNIKDMKTMIPSKFEAMCNDPYCHENMTRPIDRNTCRNNCKFWDINKCKRGYNNPKRKRKK